MAISKLYTYNTKPNNLSEGKTSVKKLLGFLILLIITSINLTAGELSNYLSQIRSSNQSDFSTERIIISSYNYQDLLNECQPFFTDSMVNVRQKTYYLLHKKGLTGTELQKKKTVNVLTNGIDDISNLVRAKNIDYLKNYQLICFDDESKSKIETLLSISKQSHQKDLILLAGYIGVGKEFLQRLLLHPKTKQNLKWTIHLALARLSDHQSLAKCMQRIKSIEVNSDMVAYLIPDLVYIRQTESIDYCIFIVQSNDFECRTADPDKNNTVLCAYRVMELIAPVINNFPYGTDGTGSLKTNDYENALQNIRNWLSNNPDYELNREVF